MNTAVPPSVSIATAPYRWYVIRDRVTGNMLAIVNAQNRAQALACYSDSAVAVEAASVMDGMHAQANQIPMLDAASWRAKQAAEAETRG